MAPEDEGTKVYPKRFATNIEGFGLLMFKVNGLHISVNVPKANKSHSLTLIIENSEGKKEYEFKPKDYFKDNPIEETVKIPLGENKVTIIAEGRFGGDFYRRELYVKGEALIYKKHGIVFTMEGDEAESFYQKELLSQIADSLNTMNLFLDDPITEVFSYWNKKEVMGTVLRQSQHPETLTLPQGIVVSAASFQYGERVTRTLFWHESSHIFENSFSEKDKEWQRFVKLFERLKELDKYGGLFGKLFNEKEYDQVRSFVTRDRPDLEPEALFCHVYQILKNNREEFYDRVSVLRSPEEVKLAKEVADFVERTKEQNVEGWAKFVVYYEELNPWFRDQELFYFFDESNYQKGTPANHGHPSDRTGELFASASAILRFYPEEFMKKVERLKGNEKEKVLNVARFVINSFLTQPNCPKELYDQKLVEFLGLERKEPLKLR